MTKTITQTEFETPFNESDKPSHRVNWPVEWKLPGKTTFKEKALAGWSTSKGKGVLRENGWGKKFGVSDEAAKSFTAQAIKAGLMRKVNFDGKVGYIWLADPTKDTETAGKNTTETEKIETFQSKDDEEMLRQEIIELEETKARQQSALEATAAELLDKQAELLTLQEKKRDQQYNAICRQIDDLSPKDKERLEAYIASSLVPSRTDADLLPLEARSLMATPTVAPSPNVPEATA